MLSHIGTSPQVKADSEQDFTKQVNVNDRLLSHCCVEFLLPLCISKNTPISIKFYSGHRLHTLRSVSVHSQLG